MIGLLSPKNEYFYCAKWISNFDRNNYAYFRFKIVTDDNLYQTVLDNMRGEKGDAVWETKSGIDFKPEDIIVFRGQKFHIKNVDGNRKAEPENEQAFMRFKNNGNLTKTLILRAG